MRIDPDPMEYSDLSKWRTFMARRYPGAIVSVEDQSRQFRTRYHCWHLGEIEFAEIRTVASQQLDVSSPRAQASDCWYLPLQLRGDYLGGQNDRQCHESAGSILLLDSRLPHWRELGMHSHLLNLRIPKAALERHLPDPHAICARPVRVGRGKARLAWDFILSVWERRAELDATDTPELTEILLRMVAGLLDGAGEASRCPARRSDTRRRQLLHHIATHLDDPLLSAARAGDACAMSARYVHMLVRATGRSFSQYVLERRLERSRMLLVASDGVHCSISGIALDCGFRDLTYFCHAFRRRYGVSAGEYRRMARSRRPA